VAYGGVDSASGADLTKLSMTADLQDDLNLPANVNPVTTVLHAAVTPEAKVAVLTALGISDDPDTVLAVEPWASAESGDEAAVMLQRNNQQLATLFITTTTIVGASRADLVRSVARATAASLIQEVMQGRDIDLTSPQNVKTVILGALATAESDVEVDDAIVGAVADSVANVNTVIGDLSLDPTSETAAQVTGAAQHSLQDSVEVVIAGDISVDDFREITETGQLLADVQVADDVPDTDGDGTVNTLDVDDDDDGVRDVADAFPLDASESLDTDGDGIGNNADADDDGDGVADAADAFPLDAFESLDTDGDGVGNNADADDDGVADAADAFPLDASESLDTDGDGIGNNADTDDDGDGVADQDDPAPLDSEIPAAPTTAPQVLELNLLPQTTNTLTGTLTSISEDNRAVVYTIETTAVLGTVTLTDADTGTFRYQTAETESGSDSFSYRVNDGLRDSEVSTIRLSLRTDPLYRYQWHLDNTGQTNFASSAATAGEDLNVARVIATGYTGDGVIVAVVDDGLEIGHEDLVDNVVPDGSYDFVDADLDPTNADLGGSHGTSVAGIIAARGWNDIGVLGVAPRASLVGLNFLESQSTDDFIVSFGGDARTADVDIFNFSAGVYLRNFVEMDCFRKTAIETNIPALRDGKGAVLIKAAGNTFRGGLSDVDRSAYLQYCGTDLSCHDAITDYFHRLPEILVIGALAADGQKASYSSPTSAMWVSGFGGQGGRHMLYSGGTRESLEPAIMTADRSTCDGGYAGTNSPLSQVYNAFEDHTAPHAENPDCNYTSIFNGTSSAAPAVAGVVALMLERNPNLTYRDVKHILAATARQVDTGFSPRALDGVTYYRWLTNGAGYPFHNFYGFGAVDAEAAMDMAGTFTADSFAAQNRTQAGDLLSTLSVTLDEGVVKSYSQQVATAGTVEFVRVDLNVEASAANFNSLGVRLESPSGTVVTLLQPHTALLMSPSSGVVELAASAFYGEEAAGNWIMHLFDHDADSQTLDIESWSLQFFYR